jgi:hypothetical protein
MKSDWLASASFVRTIELISAINTLLINAKLKLGGVPDPTGDDDIRQARERLLGFLAEFEALVRAAEDSRNGTIVGADPRLGQLALHFLTERKRGGPSLYSRPLSQTANLVRSERGEDIPELMRSLEALRSLFEQHGYADIVSLFGDR